MSNARKIVAPSLGKRIVACRYLYIMLLPALVSVIMFCYIPMTGLLLAFKELKLRGTIWNSPSVGLLHFESFFNNPLAGTLIKNTIVISLMKIVLAFPFPIILAIMLNEVRSTKYKRIVQTISYLPHFLAWVVVVAVIERLFAPTTGLINQWIGALGGDSSRFFMMEEGFFYPAMFFSYVWKTIGWNSIIYLAAVSSIDLGLYEAAKIDGANKLQEIFSITIPGIRPVMGIVFILSLGGILSAGYDQIYMLYSPGNMRVADILDTYIIRQGLEKGRFGYASAVGLIQGVTGLILVTFSNWLSRKYSETAIW